MTTETDWDTRAVGALVQLCHHGWVIPLVVHVGRQRGARFAVLLRRLGIARTTLERAILSADELDLVMRNPGHGHPMRPEYLLTPRGETIGPACEGVLVASERLDSPGLLRRKWTLPVLASLGQGAVRFSDLRRDLPSCSPRALAHALEQLQAAGWVIRDLVDQRPPRPSYGVSAKAGLLATAAVELAAAAR